MSIDVPVAVRTRRPLAAPLLVTGALVVGCGVLRAVDPSGGPTICPFKAWTGLDCPGCGATRAAHQLLNGHVLAALDLNAVFVLAAPLLAWWAIAWLMRVWNGPVLRVPRLSPAVLRVAVVVLLVFGVVRNLPVQPFSWLGTGT
jgi:hypothetical protein